MVRNFVVLSKNFIIKRLLNEFLLNDVFMICLTEKLTETLKTGFNTLYTNIKMYSVIHLSSKDIHVATICFQEYFT